MAEMQEYITLLDQGAASGVYDGGFVLPVPPSLTPEGAMIRAAREADKRAHRPHLRIFCHGNHINAGKTPILGKELLEGGYGLILGDDVVNYINAKDVFQHIKDKFASIVFYACAAAHRSKTAVSGKRGDGFAFCREAARIANAPVYAPEGLQRGIELPHFTSGPLGLIGPIAWKIHMLPWQGQVYRFTPAGGIEIIKAS